MLSVEQKLKTVKNCYQQFTMSMSMFNLYWKDYIIYYISWHVYTSFLLNVRIEQLYDSILTSSWPFEASIIVCIMSSLQWNVIICFRTKLNNIFPPAADNNSVIVTARAACCCPPPQAVAVVQHGDTHHAWRDLNLNRVTGEDDHHYPFSFTQ